VWKFWFFLVLFFCQVWLQHLSKIFDLWRSCCLLLHSGRHVDASLLYFFFILETRSHFLSTWSFHCS
jgi:hypothetical protein